MFENLTDKFDRAFKVLKGQGQITEINVAESLKEVRRALLDADVNFKTAKNFTNSIKEKALGRDVLTSVSPGQLMIKICHEELIRLMGGNEVELDLKTNPSVVLMSGFPHLLSKVVKTLMPGTITLKSFLIFFVIIVSIGFKGILK